MTPHLSTGVTQQGCAMLIVLVPLALAGLALTNTGFGRVRSAAHAMLASMAAIAIAAVVYCVCGFSWEGFAGRPAHIFVLDGKPWDWLAREPFFLHRLGTSGFPADLAILLQVFAVGLAALIPISAGADRWRLRSSCISTALLAGFTYPLFAHWVWGGGWLSQLGSTYGLGHGFLDAGGASTIQMVGGLTALAVAWILGPRRGRYPTDGMPAAIPGHNIVYVLFGCALMLPGWIGLNCASAILFSGAVPGQIAIIAVNTMLSSSAALLAAVIVTRVRFGKPDASLCANGWVGGLVASSAVCLFVMPIMALIVGLIAGVLVTVAVELLEARLAIDDPGGAISVHAVAAVWGLLAVGIVAQIPAAASGVLCSGGRGDSGQLLAQLVGIATLLGFVLPMTYCLNWLLDRISPQRVELEGERIGMDLHQLGAGAYPEFVIHSNEFMQR